MGTSSPYVRGQIREKRDGESRKERRENEGQREGNSEAETEIDRDRRT